MYSRERKLAKDIAVKVESDCFTAKERDILKIERGNTTLSVSDQFMLYYGMKFLVWDEVTTLKKIALEVEENAHLILEIETLKDKIKEITNPLNFAEVTSTEAEGKDTTTTSGDSDSVTVNTSASETTNEGIHKGLGRHLQTQTSRLVTNAETWDQNRQLSTTPQKTKRKLKIEKALNFEVSDLWQEEKEEAKTPTTPKQPEEYPNYNDLGLTLASDESHNSTSSFSDNLTAAKSKNRGEATSTKQGTGKSTREIRGESYLKTLTTEIPKIRHRFWDRLSYLFSDSYDC